MEDSLSAADFDMSTEIREAISALSISPGNATDRLEEEIDTKNKFRNK